MSQHKSGRDNQIWEVSQDFVFSRRPLQWNGTDTLLEAWLCCQAKDKEGKWSQNKKIRFFPSFWPKQVLSWSVFEGDIKKILHVCDSTLDWNLTLEWIGSLWTDDLCDIFAKCEGKKKKKKVTPSRIWVIWDTTGHFWCYTPCLDWHLWWTVH